jgi:hypothetical protein
LIIIQAEKFEVLRFFFRLECCVYGVKKPFQPALSETSVCALQWSFDQKLNKPPPLLPGNYVAKESGPVELLEPIKVSSYLLLYGGGDSSEAFGINSIVLKKKKN